MSMPLPLTATGLTLGSEQAHTYPYKASGADRHTGRHHPRGSRVPSALGAQASARWTTTMCIRGRHRGLAQWRIPVGKP